MLICTETKLDNNKVIKTSLAFVDANMNDLALAQPPRESAGDAGRVDAAKSGATEREGGCCQQRLVRPRILSFEPRGSELVMRGYDTDESGNPKLSRKEVGAVIQYLQYWADDNLINLPRWNVGTEKWEGDSQQDKLP